MSQETPDLLRFFDVVARYKALVGLTAVLGLLGGIIFAALNPTGPASKALVVFAAPQCPAGAICGGPVFSPKYIEARVLEAFPSGVEITPVTGDVLAVTAFGGTAAQAEAIANAAARSYVAAAGSLSYLDEQPSAQVIEPATTTTGTTTPKQLLGYALFGAVFGALVGIIAALAASQTIIDPPAAPAGYNLGEEAGRAGRQTSYAITQVSLQQLALEHAQRSTALDNEVS